MRVIQFGLGLGLIALTLAVETLVLIALAWIVLSVVRYIPLVGRRHRHQQWEPAHGAEPMRPGTAAHFLAAELREALRMGITTIRDVGSYGDTVVEARQAMRYGAYHYIAKDLEPESIRTLFTNASERQDLSRDVVRLREEVAEQNDREFVVGPSRDHRH